MKWWCTSRPPPSSTQPPPTAGSPTTTTTIEKKILIGNNTHTHSLSDQSLRSKKLKKKHTQHTHSLGWEWSAALGAALSLHVSQAKDALAERAGFSVSKIWEDTFLWPPRDLLCFSSMIQNRWRTFFKTVPAFFKVEALDSRGIIIFNFVYSQSDQIRVWSGDLHLGV